VDTSTPSICSLLSDDYEDGVIDPIYAIVKPNWIESGGSLNGTPSKTRASIVANGFAGCSNCSLTTSVMTEGGVFNKVWVMGWQIDKGNRIELLYKEESEKVVLKQRIGKKVVKKARAIVTIDPNIFYDTTINFDGQTFTVTIDGIGVITMPKAAGSSPFGVPGFQVKNTTGHFGGICID
jgi:hypothetical protein